MLRWWWERLKEKKLDLAEAVTELFVRNLIKNQSLGLIPTLCEKCGRMRTFKITDSNGTFTWMCGCGCSVYRYKKDKKYYSVRHYDEFERNGFKKEGKKYVK